MENGGMDGFMDNGRWNLTNRHMTRTDTQIGAETHKQMTSIIYTVNFVMFTT